MGWQDGKPIDAQPIETISPREAALRQQTGYTASGQPAPPVAMVDTQAGSAPAQPAWMSGKPYVPPAKPVAPAAPKADPILAANQAAERSEQGPVQDFIDMLKAVPSGAVQMLEGMGNNAAEHPILGNLPALVDTLKRVSANPSGTLTSISNAVQNATPEQIGRNVVGPVLMGGAAGEGVEAASALRSAASAAGSAEAASPAGQLGLRTTKPHPVAAIAAGPSAAPALDAQNQAVASTILGADAGVPHGVPVTPSALSDARAAPGNVLDQAAATIPPGPLSAGAQAKVAAARGPSTITKPTPNVAGQINDLESSLLDPNGQFTGDQIRATRNSLSSDASAGRNSPDADTRAIATYKGRLVDALDQHVADTMPADGPVSPDMVQNARSTLAKNYQLQDLLGKGGDINLQQLAKLHRDSPNLLTGNTRTVAQFASDHPEVTGGISDADRIAPPGLLRDVSGVNPFKPVSSFSQALFGRAARNTLTGPPGDSLALAQRAPVAGLGGEFDALPPSPAPGAGPIAVSGAPPSGSGPLSLADDLIAPAGNSAPKTPPAKKKRTLADDLE